MDPPPPVMRWFAAELVGLVFAMLDEGEGKTPVTSEEALEWLGNRRNTSFGAEEAWAEALEHYRIRLAELCHRRDGKSPRLLVDPASYSQLVAWCAQSQKLPTIDESVWHDDPGIVILRPDGSRDWIAVRSLFHSDDTFSPDSFMIQTGSEANNEEPPKDAWLSEEEARIGQFIGFLGGWHHVYRLAVDRIKGFPLGGVKAPRTIARAIPESKSGYKMARLLALFFQTIRMHWHAREVWRMQYEDTEWNPREMSFKGLPEDIPFETSTLRDYLKKAHEILQRWSEGTPMPPGEVMKGLAGGSWAGLKVTDGNARKLYTWVHFHIELLIKLGLVLLDKKSQYVVPKNKKFPKDILPPCPPEMRPPFIVDLVAGLGESLGHTPKSASAALRRIPAEALFGGLTPEALAKGTNFLQDLAAGVASGWLQELGREYAVKELGWARDLHWPEFLLEGG